MFTKKEWKGQATSVEEIHEILKAHTERIVRNELIFHRDTHKADVIDNPHLFKVNKIPHDERLVNLCVLLAGSSTNGTNQHQQC